MSYASPSFIRRNVKDSSDTRKQQIFDTSSSEGARLYSSDNGQSSDYNEKENKIDRTKPLTFKRIKNHVNILFHNVTRKRLPFIGRQIDKFHSLPLPVRLFGLLIFFLYKVFMAYIMIKMLLPSGKKVSEMDLLKSAIHWNQDSQGSIKKSETAENDRISDPRILQIVLSQKSFTATKNDLMDKYVNDKLIPSLLGTFTSSSSSQHKFDVDINLFLSWKPTDKLKQTIQSSLPSGTNLIIKDRISSFQKDSNESGDIDYTRLVVINEYQNLIKQKLDEYDFFAVFDDNNRLTAEHIFHYLETVKKLDGIIKSRSDATDNRNVQSELASEASEISFLKKLVPGFLLVNVLPQKQSLSTLEDIDSTGNLDSHDNTVVDPSICCRPLKNDDFQSIPESNHVIMQQSTLSHSGIRGLPVDESNSLRRIILEQADVNNKIPKNKLQDKKQLRKGDDKMIFTKVYDNSIGWMGTRAQIIQWISQDGCFEDVINLNEENLKLYSEQSFIKGTPPGCNLIPFLTLEKENFSKQLVYQEMIESPSIKNSGRLQHTVMRVNKFYQEINELAHDKLR